MNILSVDVDYAYSPTIAVYDDFVEGSRVSLEEQQKIFSDLSLPLPAVNEKKIEYLKEVVRRSVDASTPIIIGEHHHEILQFLPTKKEFSIINFDHHHDIYYPGWHSLDKLDEGNWVYFLKEKPIIKYTWVRNEDSEDMPDDLPVDFNVQEVLHMPVSDIPKSDLVFFCVSSHWTGSTGRSKVLELISEIR